MKLKLFLRYLFPSVDYSLRSLLLTTKGQIPKYEILQLSHRLEKGLLVETPKPLWGWEKAERMAALISKNDDAFSNKTGRGVLKAYIEAKKKSENIADTEKAKVFEKRYPDILNEEVQGGVLSLLKEDITFADKESIKRLFNTRHSCRDYQDVFVSKDDIRSAISLALKCPSACNRQVTNCYVYQSKELQTIILTTNVRAFEVGEFNDWFISPGIFAGYLSLTLHLYGIGSCVYRKQLYGHHSYNEEMRVKCKIPKDEMIMLELRFGYYKDEFRVPFSNRHTVDDISFFIGE